MIFEWARAGTDGTLWHRPLVHHQRRETGISLVTVGGDLRQGLLKNNTSHPRSAVIALFKVTAAFDLYINQSDFTALANSPPKSGSKWQQGTLRGTSPDEFFKSVSYFLSDIIVIQHHHIEQAVEEYLEWIRVCRNLKRTRRQIPPFSLIYVASTSAEVWRATLARKFAQTKMGVSFEQYSKNLPHPLFVSSLQCLRDTTMCLVSESQKLRQIHRHLWSKDEFSKLQVRAGEIFSRSSQLSFDEVEVLVPLEPFKAAIGCLLGMKNLPQEIAISVISCNLARYALGGCHLFHSDDLFDSFEKDLCGASPKSNTEGRWWERLRQNLKVTMDRYEQAGDNLDDVHLQSLAHHASYLTSVHPFWACMTCLLSASRVSLSCGHAFCEICIQRYASTKANSEGRGCPFCPPAASVTEEQSASSQNGIAALVYKYHDLVMGLIDVSIRLRPWSPYMWLRTVTAFVKVAIGKPERWLDLKGGWGNTWRNLISLATNDYPYEGQVIRNGLMSAFGVDIFPISANQKQIDYKLLWPLVTNLFFFELHSIQKREGLAYDCEGTIRCQPIHHPLFQQVAKLCGKSISLRVQDKVFMQDPPYAVCFSVSELNQSLDMQLCVGSLSSSIAGFPSTILRRSSSRKRQCDHESAHKTYAKRRRLQIE
ncbi:MAG: hypothetical protein Q9188_001372 [Gyalolechia gomerana]